MDSKKDVEKEQLVVSKEEPGTTSAEVADVSKKASTVDEFASAPNKGSILAFVKSLILNQVVLTLVMTLGITAGAIFAYDHFFALKIVSVDITGYVAKLEQDNMAKYQDLLKKRNIGQITDDEMRKTVNDLIVQEKADLDYINYAIDSLPKNTVVILRDVAVRHIDEITINNPALTGAKPDFGLGTKPKEVSK